MMAENGGPSRLRRTLWIVGVTAGIFGLIAAAVAIGGHRGATGTPITATTVAGPNVVFKVDGTAATASLTYTTPTGQSQVDAVLPLTNKAGGTGFLFTFTPGSELYLSAQNDGADGSVTCHILVDGVQVSENTSDGGYQIATCEGSA